MLAGKKCDFCGRDIRLGQGMMVVKNDGETLSYCSSKCRKNAIDLHRDPRKLKWTAFYVKGA